MILPNLTLNYPYFLFNILFTITVIIKLFLEKKKILIHKTFNNTHKENFK